MKYLIIFFLLFLQSKNEYPILKNFYGIECETTIFDKNEIKKRISYYRKDEDGSITLEVTTGETCGKIKEGFLEVKGDTLNLRYHGKQRFKTIILKSDSVEEIDTEMESIVFCDCKYELTYEIKADKNKNYVYQLNNELIEIEINNAE